ncbi:hypothetical protein [Bordetella hinzii]|uniref:hypothetical protein n=1 Tax=Bordetella hinzii TaxID=103855 RepID=UPI001C01D961|nr:hypothetical protein [Bordetella hinzii]QWF40569.1 hypothetical protein HHA25_21040 [Bordetella hinzii]QWF45117.1 hypothetical protein HHA24_21030 [Bordetella hinzii]QWF49653.1 hypothetical protein HHA23_21030 [Bordetella hinzii]QWF54189.1 hypothetical protein HHA22_21035 [Bordetella hinzii]QWF58680.1 hypothetical protein HHA21_20790 [Bordetella hinzii]
MAIQKQEFYEGAAIHQLIRGSSGARVIYAPPLFIFDERLQVHLKYSTAKRSPWSFTFVPDEQVLLLERAEMTSLVIGLICGADGIAALPYSDYAFIASLRNTALHVSCRRNHREHFEISGPDGILPGKVAPADWSNLLGKRGDKAR